MVSVNTLSSHDRLTLGGGLNIFRWRPPSRVRLLTLERLAIWPLLDLVTSAESLTGLLSSHLTYLSVVESSASSPSHVTSPLSRVRQAHPHPTGPLVKPAYASLYVKLWMRYAFIHYIRNYALADNYGHMSLRISPAEQPMLLHIASLRFSR